MTGHSEKTPDFSTTKTGGIKAQGLLCLGSLLRGTWFKLLLYYFVIAPRLNYFKDLDIQDSAVGPLRLCRWGTWVWGVAVKGPQSQPKWGECECQCGSWVSFLNIHKLLRPSTFAPIWSAEVTPRLQQCSSATVFYCNQKVSRISDCRNHLALAACTDSKCSFTAGTGMAYMDNSLTAVPLALETSLEQVFTVTFEVLDVICPHLPPAAKWCLYQQHKSFLHSTFT